MIEAKYIVYPKINKLTITLLKFTLCCSNFAIGVSSITPLVEYGYSVGFLFPNLVLGAFFVFPAKKAIFSSLFGKKFLIMLFKFCRNICGFKQQFLLFKHHY